MMAITGCRSPSARLCTMPPRCGSASSNDDDRLSDAEKKVSWITAASAVALSVRDRVEGCARRLSGRRLAAAGRGSVRTRPAKTAQTFSMVVVLCLHRSASGTCSGTTWSMLRSAPIISEAISLAIATLVCFSVSARIFRPMPDRIGDWEREWCRDLYAAAGALFAMTLVWLKLPPPVVALVWTVLGLALFEIGVRFATLALSLVGPLDCVPPCAFDCLCSTSPDSAMRSKSPIERSRSCRSSRRSTTSGGAISGTASRWERASSRLYVYTAAVLFVVLARFELGRTLAVVAWALFGLALYEIGQLREHRGSALAKLCARAALVLFYGECWPEIKPASGRMPS